MSFLTFPTEYNLKNSNKRIILDMIRFTPGGASRAELARRMGLTRSAITTIVSDILSDQLVRETNSGPTTGGRRPILLEINPGRGWVVGIDMGSSHLGMIVTDFSASILHETEVPFDVNLGPEKCVPLIDQQFHRLLEKVQISPKDIMAVGMGVPGPVVIDAGLVSAPPIMSGWDKFPIRATFQQMWQTSISVNNDAELGALGEWAYGAGRGERHLAYVKVGTGIGAGLLFDGNIYRGATGSAGEIGHITILDGGPTCVCGNTGCLEALAGGRAIARKAREAIRAGKRTQLSAIRPIEDITAIDVVSAARLGDLVAQQILSEAGRYLGIAIASLVNLFNPNVVVVGGGVAVMGDLLLEPIRQALRERSIKSAAEIVRVTSALLGRRSTSMGAVVQALNLALQTMFEA